MSAPTASYIDGDRAGRLHLQHGPIDLIIGVGGAESLELEAHFRQHAYMLAHRRFQTVLAELVDELPLLKMRTRADSPEPRGSTAQRMMGAVRPFSETHFITPMAAVAGAVADEMLATMLAGFRAEGRPQRIYVNNGGDIAIHLDAGTEFRIGMSRDDGTGLGAFAIHPSQPSRGIATSGRGGRSLSMGIANSVTILARNAAEADAAASLVGNAVDLPNHPSVMRVPAVDLVDDSDLGQELVVKDCGELTDHEVGQALEAGAAEAERFIKLGLIHRGALFLRDRGRLVEAPDTEPAISALETRHYA